MPDDPARADTPWLVACLCAAWCRTCDGYRTVLAEAARAHPEATFVWVDIEDHADDLDDPNGAADDIENFPTLLLVRGDVPHFFGTVMPQPGVLMRMLGQARAGELPPVRSAAALHMARAVAPIAAPPPAPQRLS